MPQASEYTRNKYANMIGEYPEDGETWLISRGYSVKHGYIRAPIDHVESEKDAAALDYLCQEWDYAFLGELE